MASSIFAGFVEEVREALLAYNPTLHPVSSRLEDTSFRSILDGLESAIQALDSAEDELETLAALGQLVIALGDFRGLPDCEDILVRWLQHRYPRWAATFSLLKVIEYQVQGTGAAARPVARVDWSRLTSLATQPQSLFNESWWSGIASQEELAQSPSERLAGTLFAALILVPQVLFSLVGIGIQVQPLPPVPGGTGLLNQFRTARRNWFSMTFPFGIEQPSGPGNPRSIFDNKPGLAPDASPTLAIRSYRDTNNIGHMEVWFGTFLGQQTWTAPLGREGWKVRIDTGNVDGAVGLLFKADSNEPWCWPKGAKAALPPLTTNPNPTNPPDQNSIRYSFYKETEDGQPLFIIGSPGSVHLQVGNIEYWLSVGVQQPLYGIGVRLLDFGVVVGSRFLSLLGDGIVGGEAGLKLTADLDLAFYDRLGFRANVTDVDFDAALGLHAVYPIDWQLGTEGLSLYLKSLRMRAPIEARGSGTAPRIRAECLITAETQMGPVQITLEDTGSWIGYDPDENDPDEIDFLGFVPPRGMGVVLDAGPVTGGGFLRYESLGSVERYLGGLEVKVTDIAVTAYGIFEKRPDYKSFIVVLGARFPGIQLGFGVELNGIGGLVGINRRSDTDLLRDRLESGASGEVLFTDDPVSNAPALLADLDQLFPSARGIFVVGPTIKLGWLAFMRFDLGVLIEFPGPSKIIILGRMQAELLPPLLQIQLEVLGVIDFVKKIIQIDASLVNSRLLEIFQLSGDAAFRLSWGASPYMMLSIGGFHPEFDPRPVAFPPLDRVGMSYEVGSTVKVWLRLEGYLAVTSNTFQVGARVEAGVKIGKLRAEGFISFDALIQFRPFYFTVDFAAGFKIAYGSFRLASLRVRGTLSGPGPVKIKARFSFSILFFEISFKKTFKLGSSEGDSLEPVADLLPLIAAELSEASNVEALGGDDREVIVSAGANGDRAVISPLGRLSWSQRRIPFDLEIERFEGVPLGTPMAVVLVSNTEIVDRTSDWFSPGSYRDLSASESLNQSAFNRLESGAVFSFGDVQPGHFVDHDVKPVTFRIVPGEEDESVDLEAQAIPFVVQMSIYGRSAETDVYESDPLIAVSEETFTHYDDDGSVMASSLTEADAQQRAAGSGGVATADGDEPIEIPA